MTLSRIISRLAVLAVLAAPIAAPLAASAQTASPSTTPTTPHKATGTARLQKRFDAANATHDGHLTLDQARAANWKMVVARFSKIDVDGKGYITIDELANVQAQARAQRAAKAGKPAPAGTVAPPVKG